MLHSAGMTKRGTRNLHQLGCGTMASWILQTLAEFWVSVLLQLSTAPCPLFPITVSSECDCWIT